MDEVPLWRNQDHVPVRQLVEDFAKRLYLPKVTGPEVVARALSEGVALLTWAQETFAYADGFDEKSGRYEGLRAGKAITITPNDPGLVVKPDVARQQIAVSQEVVTDADGEDESKGGKGRGGETGTSRGKEGQKGTDAERRKEEVRPRRMFATVKLDPVRAVRAMGEIAEEILDHIQNEPGAEVELLLEIQARVPGGISRRVQDIVRQNAEVLGFQTVDFEEE